MEEGYIKTIHHYYFASNQSPLPLILHDENDYAIVEKVRKLSSS